MITAIELENFRGIRDRVRIELRPITLLFGPNSAGKSTVLQALHYAREIFERHNLDPDQTLGGGAGLDLGGFQAMVHGHDLSRPIWLKFDLDLHLVDLPDYGAGLNMSADVLEMHQEDQAKRTDPDEWDSIPRPTAGLSRLTETASVEVTLEWSDYLRSAQLTRYAVWLNGEAFGAIVASLDGVQCSIHDLNPDHPFLKTGDEDDEGILDPDIGSALAGYFDLFGTELGFFAAVAGQRSALPRWEELLDMPQREPGFRDLDYHQRREARELLTQAFVGPGELLRDALRAYRYLGPMRQVPPRTHEPTRSECLDRWANGLAAWDILAKRGNGFARQVSEWLSSERRLNTGYSVTVKRFKELDAALLLAFQQDKALDASEHIAEELARLPERHRLMLVEEATGIELLPCDVGVGVSQVLPVVVLALDTEDGIAAIEQPELHIHPAIQVGLGDLFIEQGTQPGSTITNQGTISRATFLVETHSEHLMLRMLRRIEETTKGKLEPGDPALRPDQIAVYYVEPGPEGVHIEPLPIDETGEFTRHWPKGFFEERAEELFR